jgi:hypothetical protein
MVTIKAGDGCTTSGILHAPDDRHAQEATGAFVFPQQFLNPPSHRGVPAARAVDKGLPLLGHKLERVYKQLLRGLSRLTHESRSIQPK